MWLQVPLPIIRVQLVVQVLPGQTITLAITCTGYGLDYNVYVDYNNNGVYTDAGELVMQVGVTSPGVATEVL